MNRSGAAGILVAIAIVAGSAGVVGSLAGDAGLTVEAERRAKEAYFRDNPWSPLRAFARHDFSAEDPAPAVLGSGEGADVRLKGPGIAARQARIDVLAPRDGEDAYRFRVENLAGDGRVVAADAALGAPGAGDAIRVVPEETMIGIDPFALRPYVQGGAGILIVFDSRLTAEERFVPPRYFPVDPSWSFRARLVREADPETLPLQTSLGRTKEYRRVGHFDLTIAGEEVRVNAYEPLFVAHEGELLMILFSDRTTGEETYGAGRYVDLEPPSGDGFYTIDFNRAYNPFCSYTNVYNCPIPPRENRLEVAVRAGEKAYPHPIR